VSKDCELRIWNGDNFEIERFTSVKRDDLPVRQPDSEIAIPIVGDRENGELLRDATKLSCSRRVLLEKGVQRPT
jgi:hypothetical protein